MTDLDPNHPLLIQGRRHAREAIFSAERFGRIAGSGDKASTVSLALQFVVGAAMTDGTDIADVYNGIGGFLIWATEKLPQDQRETVFGAIRSGRHGAGADALARRRRRELVLDLTAQDAVAARMSQGRVVA